MGTLIQDAAEVATIAGQIDTAITTKGGTLVGGGKLRNAVAGINSIPTGSSQWQPPSGWPNIRTLLANDTETAYTHKTYILHLASSKATVAYNSPKWITSDGATYYGSATHTWADPTAMFGWVACYSNDADASPALTAESGTGYAQVLWIASNGKFVLYQNNQCRRLRCIEATSVVLNASTVSNVFWNFITVESIGDFGAFTTTSTNSRMMFSGCELLKSVPSDITTTGCTNTYQMFYNCNSLKAVPSILDLSSSTNTSQMFYNCYALENLPDTMNLSASTNVNAMFTNCYALKALPTNLTVNLSFSFQNSQFVSKASVATFDDDANPTALTGGMLGNINTVSSAQTITLAWPTKNLFTDDQQAVIATALSAKNWTVSWA